MECLFSSNAIQKIARVQLVSDIKECGRCSRNIITYDHLDNNNNTSRMISALGSQMSNIGTFLSMVFMVILT